MAEPVYRRVVIKLSGEYLAGSHSFGIDQPTVDRIADDLIAAKKLGVEVSVLDNLSTGHRATVRVPLDEVVRERLVVAPHRPADADVARREDK